MFKRSVESLLGQTSIKTLKYIRNILICSNFSQTKPGIFINWIIPVYFNVLMIGLMPTLADDWVSDPAKELRGVKYFLVAFWVFWRVN